LTYLNHPYPRVRRFAAETLYIVVVSFADVDMTALETLLTETDWNEPVDSLRSITEEIGKKLAIATL
jgi:hypothetical protein